MLTRIATGGAEEGGGVWAAECALRNMVGVAMTTRMTVIGLAGGRLVLHAPVRLTPAVRDSLDGLGQVAWIVAPNRFHHMFVADYLAAYPSARLAGAPGLPAKRRDLPFDVELGATRELPDWSGTIEYVVIGGSRTMGEVAFFHAPSGSLLLTDLLLNTAPASPRGLRLWAWLNGVRTAPGTAGLVRLTYRDRKAARASVARILDWDFRRIIPCHGPVVEEDARGVFERAVAWLR